MKPTYEIVEGPYLRDILDQPRALENFARALPAAPSLDDVCQRLREGRFRRIVLTGMGSSYFALYPLWIDLVRRGLPALWLETAELLHSFAEAIDAQTLVVAVSQSGQSAETVRLLEGGRPIGYTIGVTNNEQSSLARRAQTTLLLHAGAESTVSCKTYLSTLAALRWLSLALGGGERRLAESEVAEAVRGVAGYLSAWREHVAAFVALLGDATDVFVTGRGTSLAAANLGGLTLKEATRVHAEGMSCPAFRHGPFELLNERVFVLVFAGDERTAHLNRRLVEDVLAAGGRAALAACDSANAALRLPHVPEGVRPIVEALPVQMLSLALAARAGREAGRFERATKVTVVE